MIPRNRFINLYLHKFLRSDDDRALHDHPWWFISFLIQGQYREILPTSTILRHQFSLAFRRAKHIHRVELIDNEPCYTLVLTGRKIRKWGFWCPQGFIPYDIFTKPHNTGEIGRGCD